MNRIKMYIEYVVNYEWFLYALANLVFVPPRKLTE